MNDLSRSVLLVIDVQRGFANPKWGRRDRPECEANIGRLLAAFRGAGRPVVFVRHDSVEPDSPLRPETPGNAFQDVLTGEPDLLVCKSVNSAFYGTPDLDGWLRERGLRTLVICGITTNHCCETTARMGGNLSYDVRFVLDATHTFDRVGPDGATISAEALAATTAANLHKEFAVVTSTEAVVRALPTATIGSPGQSAGVVPARRPIDLEGRRFRSVRNVDHGDVSSDTLFAFSQKADVVTARYAGGSVREGHLVALMDAQGNLQMRYHHVTSEGELKTGECVSTLVRLPDGRLAYDEEWQWTCGSRERGRSRIEEIAPATT